jgi:hypothetical protein
MSLQSVVAELAGDEPDIVCTREIAKVYFPPARTRISVRKFRRKLRLRGELGHRTASAATVWYESYASTNLPERAYSRPTARSEY